MAQSQNLTHRTRAPRASALGKAIGLIAFILLVAAAIVAVGWGGEGSGGGGSGGGEGRVVLGPIETVKIKDKTFKLEVAATNDARMKGLGGRTELAPDGGMLFVFPRAQRLQFVMRDCLIPIDIIFLDSAGRVTAIHTMPNEEPRRADEDEYAYEFRLKKYSSRFPAQYAIEIQAGMAAKIGIKEGEKIELNTARLGKASELELVKLGSEEFYLELAASEPIRNMGLSNRTEIPADGGMLFVFPDEKERFFVMRDCPIPIDIIYLNAAGTVVSTHEMLPEPPRQPTETGDTYELRLKPYPSQAPMQFAIELRGGTIRKVGVRPGDRVPLDVERLKRIAR